ncbi:MAG TPA: ABC transporter permease, partial [Blastocatellia bacterium]|nr:ABC transporter permease [Blastocatellia bacterium]
VSHGLWRQHFESDRGLVGRTIVLNGYRLTVIGVMPEGFHGTWPLGWAPELWVPVTMQPQLLPGADRSRDRGNAWLQIFGRLGPGVSPVQAQASVDPIGRRLAEIYPGENNDLKSLEIYPLSEVRGASFAQVIPLFLEILIAIVGLVLLIACANIANLLLARAVSRQQEIAIRLALGANRWRLIRQFLTESILLALSGGAAGCLLAVWLTASLRSFRLPTPIPIELNATLDARVLGFTLAISVLSGILFGLAPAWQSSKSDLITFLKNDRRTVSGKQASFSLRNLLVISQVTVSLILLICAGLFTRSLQYARNVDPGFEINRMLTVPIDLETVRYQEARGRLFYQQLLDQIEQLPGVQSASLAQIVPLTFSRRHAGLAIDDQQAPDDRYPEVDSNTVGPRYFETMGIPVLAGRELGRQDSEGAPLVAVINETMARRFWPAQNPLGRRLRIHRGNHLFSPYYQVVGVVKDSKYVTLGEEPKPFYYLSALQEYGPSMVLHVRTMGEPNQLRGAVRERILTLDRALLVQVATMRENLAVTFLPMRVAAVVLGLFGLLGLILAVMGIYSVISYNVSQRTGEIGLRMALGARTLNIFWLVIGHGLKLTLIGVALGAAAALALTRILTSLLVGVNPADPLTFLLLAMLLAIVTLLACWIPARRATKLDPMIALRHN